MLRVEASRSATPSELAAWTGVSMAMDPARRPVGPSSTRLNPAVLYPKAPAPVGSGANAKIRRIPDAVWKRMLGVSWSPGCMARSRLRYVTVNYWGFDGYRHRGEVVLSAGSAGRYAKVLSELYDQGYPIRQMRLVDDFGRSRWKGANDYASMAADNTSGFNCRYVVGREERRVMSPHAYGYALDINPFENPYVSRKGIYPSSMWLSRAIGHPAVLTTTHPALRIFTRNCIRWCGAYADYHHFEAGSGCRS